MWDYTDTRKRACVRIISSVSLWTHPFQQFPNHSNMEAMPQSLDWTPVFSPPPEPISVRLKVPWLVQLGAKCPGCGVPVSNLGSITHECGEVLEVVDSAPALVLLVRYPAGYLVVRSDRWDRYLIKVPCTSPIEGDSRVPLSTLHGEPWVIWDRTGTKEPHWERAHHCPECGKAHDHPISDTVFRCECRTRLLPLPAEIIVGFTPADVVGKLWDERALVVKHRGRHLLWSMLNFPRPEV